MYLALLLAANLVVEPPPGWSDVTAARAGRNVVASLKGPETSSFVLTRIPPLALENRAVVRGLLHDVLAEMESRMKLGLRPASNLQTTRFQNGLTAHYIRAEGKSKEKLILAVTQAQGETMLVTLVSAVPDTILPSLMNGVKAGSAEAATARSTDGQLDFTEAGLTPRPLTARERKGGFVAALSAKGTEILIMRLSEDSTPLQDQPDLVAQTVLAIPGATAAGSLRRVETPAGPQGIYVAAGPAAAGYLPWAYWGYSLLAQGPHAGDAMEAVLATAKRGPDADPKLVDATPRVPVKGGVPKWLIALIGLAFAASVVAWWRRRNTLT